MWEEDKLKLAVERGKNRFSIYYKEQKIVLDEEWDSFWNILVVDTRKGKTIVFMLSNSLFRCLLVFGFRSHILVLIK